MNHPTRPASAFQRLRYWVQGPGRSYWRRFGAPLFFMLGLGAVLAALAMDSQRILAYSFQLNPTLVLLSVVIEFSGLILAVAAWHLILARLGSRLSYQDDIRIYCYTIFGVVLPGGVWSLVGRVTLYGREGVPGLKVTVATIVEFILVGLAGLAVYALAMLIRPVGTVWQQPEIALGVTILVLILVQPPVFNRIIGLALRRSGRTADNSVALRYQDLTVLLVLEFLTVIIGGTAVYVLLQSFVAIPPELYVVVVGAWGANVAAGNLLFWFPAKPFLRDGVTALVLAQVLPPALALAFVLILRVWTIASVMIAAGLAWLLFGRKFYASVK